MAAPRNDNVKEKILDAATGLLDTQTFADISLAEIAAAAGVSKGTLYYPPLLPVRRLSPCQRRAFRCCNHPFPVAAPCRKTGRMSAT